MDPPSTRSNDWGSNSSEARSGSNEPSSLTGEPRPCPNGTLMVAYQILLFRKSKAMRDQPSSCSL